MTQGTFLGEQRTSQHQGDGLTAALGRWVAFCLLLANLVAGALLPSGPAFADPARTGIEICTASGMVFVDQNGTPIQGQAQAAATCVFCLPLFHAAGGPPAVAVAPVEPLGEPRQLSFTAEAQADLAAPWRSRASAPRAPPLA